MMKKLPLLFAISMLLFALNTETKAQTAGILTFTFKQSPATSSATKNVMAVWIEDASGNFIKTNVRYWGNGTNDHLPTWVSKSGQNTVDAITGSTLKSTTNPTAFGTKTILWKGKNVSGNIVADGTYKVFVESAYSKPEPPDNAHSFLSQFSFTKGPSVSITNPTDVNLTNVSLTWAPSYAGISTSHNKTKVVIAPNPVKTLLGINFEKSQEIQDLKIYNTSGKLVYQASFDKAPRKHFSLNVSTLSKGIYFVSLKSSNGENIKSRFIKS